LRLGVRHEGRNRRVALEHTPRRAATGRGHLQSQEIEAKQGNQDRESGRKAMKYQNPIGSISIEGRLHALNQNTIAHSTRHGTTK